MLRLAGCEAAEDNSKHISNMFGLYFKTSAGPCAQCASLVTFCIIKKGTKWELNPTHWRKLGENLRDILKIRTETFALAGRWLCGKLTCWVTYVGYWLWPAG